ncbi:uncharacterized protein TNIN_223931 [Trichonephila inaurata madagascariensis]|uniref:Uncharacterized protein n=1 Tax=Trichonephila inaurata madagascariensis TaxID=2747483 RepID=A0A8X6YCW1_9ARAC|nr:uncharacterized protein TNIN_223931 [Trichonephila inaurata madagascariensis]
MLPLFTLGWLNSKKKKLIDWDRWRGLVIQLLWKSRLLDGVELGVLSPVAVCRTGVRSKHLVGMVGRREPCLTRSSKEERTSPGRKRSRQKFPRDVVVGLRL